jgi:hypothetical protein
MWRLVALLAVLASGGCGGSGVVTGGDASTDAATVNDAAPDGPPVYCSEWCGAVASSDVPDAGRIIVCPPGQFCGETGGAPGWRCCGAGWACTPGTQHGYGCP